MSEQAINIHIEEQVLHFTNDEPVVIAPSVQAHLNNTDVHITNSERQTWNNKQEEIDIDLVSIFEGKLA